ncbi:MAG: hypothetical protein FWE08_02935 [Oscillospiraceae bacterium]|nr:hypothetical protein [Oscillospiraceae bacterium]
MSNDLTYTCIGDYNTLLLLEQLYPHCREIDEPARHRLATIAGREVAHESILTELVYT